MRNQDYTAKILNLADVIITEENCTEDLLHISIGLSRRPIMAAGIFIAPISTSIN